METVALVTLGAVLFLQAWHMLRFTDAKLVGIVAVAAAVVLALLALWKPLPLAAVKVDPGAASAWILLVAIYAAALAAVSLGGFDTRSLGFYSLFVAAASLLLTVHFVQVEEIVPDFEASRSSLLVLTSLVQVVLFGLQFFYLGVPFRRLQVLVGWFFLVGAVILAVMGVGIPMGLWPDEAIAR